MSHQQAPVVYQPPSPPSYSPSAPPRPVVAQYEGHNTDYQVPYVAAPPPAGYPTAGYGPAYVASAQTNSKGEGFWKGCVAALCCCWVLDFCCC